MAKTAMRHKSHPTSRLRQVAWWARGGQYAAEVLKGVVAYNKKHQGWTIHQIWEMPDEQWPTWNGDGVLSCQVNAFKHLVEQIRVPVVDISADRAIPSLPWVESDNAGIGRMAAEHLVERGLRHFGFYGFVGENFSDWRRDGFVRRLQQSGFGCEIYTINAHDATAAHPEAFFKWLAKLPKPVGIFGDLRVRAQEILEACRRQRLGVPEDVAVITTAGCDECVELENPPLTSVMLNTHRIGYEAAALLDRLMSGIKEPPGTAHLVAPIEVVPQQSTELLAMPDPLVATALRYIWQHACEGIHVKDVLRKVPLSRLAIERRFQPLVGRSIHEEILRVQMNQIKTLLTQTDLPLAQIADRAGFKDVTYLVRAFHRELGVSPGKYRAQHAQK